MIQPNGRGRLDKIESMLIKGEEVLYSERLFQTGRIRFMRCPSASQRVKSEVADEAVQLADKRFFG
jgi:hypothetical protein